MTLTQLKQVIDNNFGHPFLPEGQVRTRMTDSGNLAIYIGRRDIELNDEGQVVGAGTSGCVTSPGGDMA